jgi:hypothetical protein
VKTDSPLALFSVVAISWLAEAILNQSTYNLILAPIPKQINGKVGESRNFAQVPERMEKVVWVACCVAVLWRIWPVRVFEKQRED